MSGRVGNLQRFDRHDDVVLRGVENPDRDQIGVVTNVDGKGVHVLWSWGRSICSIDDLDHYEGPITGRAIPPEKGPRRR